MCAEARQPEDYVRPGISPQAAELLHYLNPF